MSETNSAWSQDVRDMLQRDMDSWMDLQRESLQAAAPDAPVKWYEQLKKLRKAHRLTQAEVADKLGVARTTYLYIEAGARMIRGDELMLLADLYQIPANEILTVPVVRDPQPEYEEAWTRLRGDEAALILAVRNDDLQAVIRWCAEHWKVE